MAATKAGDIDDIKARLALIQSKRRRRCRGNEGLQQMCCMWSTNNPPDIIEGTAPLCNIEDAFDIEISPGDALQLYDMDLDEAARMIVRLRKKHA